MSQFTHMAVNGRDCNVYYGLSSSAMLKLDVYFLFQCEVPIRPKKIKVCLPFWPENWEGW